MQRPKNVTDWYQKHLGLDTSPYELKKEGVTVLDDIETYPYGKFVHIQDPEGNKIQLWEPVD